MSTVTVYFSDSMVESLIAKEVNIVSIKDSDMEGQKLVEISADNCSDLYRVFSAGFDWANKMRAEVGS